MFCSMFAGLIVFSIFCVSIVGTLISENALHKKCHSSDGGASMSLWLARNKVIGFRPEFPTT